MLASLSAGWTHDPLSYGLMALVFFFGGLAPLPRTPFVIAGGLVFGLLAIPIIAVSSTLGSVAAFALARFLVYDRVRRALDRRRLTGALLRAVDLEGWRILALMRFYGPLPTTVQNYGFALTRISLVAFALTTLVFSIPQITLYCYLGSLGQLALRGEFPGWVSIVTAAAAITCASLAVLAVGHRVRAILREAGASEADLVDASVTIS